MKVEQKDQFSFLPLSKSLPCKLAAAEKTGLRGLHVYFTGTHFYVRISLFILFINTLYRQICVNIQYIYIKKHVPVLYA